VPAQQEVEAGLSSRANAPRAYVAVAECEVEHAEPLKTGFFDIVNQVKAVTVVDKKLCVIDRGRSLADARGYEKEDLYAVAEIAYHYLMNGATKVALTLFEGLTAVMPNEAYFALGLGLSHDHLGEKQEAYAAYTRAAELDPQDARADINRAELLIESRDAQRARQLLMRGLAKAKNRGDATLEKKARAMLDHISKAA
jgi:tetratricopeptide (TPR) repeat protein